MWTLHACREVQRILMELLNQMDGFDQNVNVKVCPLVHADSHHELTRTL
jgi:ATP-dependent 26S proteasome regulatory subunit